MEKPKYNVLQNVSFMIRIAWRTEKSVLWLCLILVALQLGVNVSQLFLGPVILERVEFLAPLPELIGTILGFSLVLALLNGLLGYARENTLYGRVDVRCAIINDINEKALTTAYPNTRDPAAMKLQENAMNACSSNGEPAEHIWTTLTALLLNLGGFAIYLSLLSDLNLYLILLVSLTTAIAFFVNRYIHEWGYRHRDEQAAYRRKMSYIRRKTESIQLAKDIRIFGLGPWLNSVYESVMRLYDGFVNRRERVYTWSCVVDVILSLARNGIAYFYLIRLTLRDGLPASEFLLYFTAFTGFSSWVTGILEQCAGLHKESLGISQVQEYLNLPEPFRFEDGQPVPQTDQYELQLDHVSFRYPGTDRDIFHDLSLTLHPGEKLAVVGLNGAGKTTLVKLLCGFYDPDEGRVLLNGTDVRTLDRREYYKLFSAVFQEHSDLDITVEETVAQTVEGIEREKVETCLEQAGLLAQIQALPKGLDTHLGKKVYLDGVELSGGQTQRLLLARALYKDGPFMILDEPTAALDPIAENDIYQKYNEMTAGKSSVFISHRLASTRFCDRILFLHHGVIEEQGTHEELMQRGGGYARLFHVQARYYQEGREFDEAEF